MSDVDQANRLIALMKTHAEKEINTNAIKRMNQIGRITGLPTIDEPRYLVSIDGDIVKLPCRSDLNLAIGNIVIIMAFNGNINQRWIFDKKDWTSW